MWSRTRQCRLQTTCKILWIDWMYKNRESSFVNICGRWWLPCHYLLYKYFKIIKVPSWNIMMWQLFSDQRYTVLWTGLASQGEGTLPGRLWAITTWLRLTLAEDNGRAICQLIYQGWKGQIVRSVRSPKIQASIASKQISWVQFPAHNPFVHLERIGSSGSLSCGPWCWHMAPNGAGRA